MKGQGTDLVTDTEHTLHDGATSDTPLEVIDLRTRLVHVKGTDDNELRRGQEVTGRDGDLLDKELEQNLDIETKLGRDGDDWGTLSDGATKESHDLLVVLSSRSLLKRR